MNSRQSLLQTLSPYINVEQRGDLWSNVYYEVILRNSVLVKVQIHTSSDEEEWSIEIFDILFEVAFVNGNPKDKNSEIVPGIILSFLEAQM